MDRQGKSTETGAEDVAGGAGGKVWQL